MTREEAIKELKQRLSTLKFTGGSYVDCVNGEAIETVIDALKAGDVEKLQRQMYKAAANSFEWQIPLDDFFEIIKHRFMRESYIVHLKYRYEHELNFTYSVEVLENENGDFIWLNDWDEGQTDVYVVNAVPLAEVFDYIANDQALLKILMEGTK